MNIREWGVALLCTVIPADDLTPLTLAQLRTLGARVRAMGAPAQPMNELRPEDLCRMGYPAPEAARICALLDREERLERYLDGARSKGIYPLTRLSPEYPERLRALLGMNAPPILFCAGDAALLSKPAVAVVGSRALHEPGRSFCENIGKLAAGEGVVLVSGNAVGADQTAQDACYGAGGSVICFLADELSRHLPRSDRELMISAGGYDLPFTNARALSRNHFIHAQGRKVFVAQCDSPKGGTWAGTTENLSRGWSEVYACDDGTPAMGELIERGATPVPKTGLRSLEEAVPFQGRFLAY